MKKNLGQKPDIFYSRYKICVSGAAETSHFNKDVLQKAELLGKLIAEKNLILVTGATTGAPYWAAKGAKEAGGFVIGISPAATVNEHLNVYKLPLDYHDLIVYTGFGYAGRNLLLTRASDAVITVCGRMGTLNEFTDAFEDGKPQGVISNAGGTTDLIPQILTAAHRGQEKVVFDSDPKSLLDKVIAMIKAEERSIS